MTKISNTSIDKYRTCPLMYKYHYLDNLRPVYIGSALVFGSAMDDALNVCLLHKKYNLTKEEESQIKKDPIEVFNYSFTDFKINGKIESLPKSMLIDYGNKDLDVQLLTSDDYDHLGVCLTDLDYGENAKELLNEIITIRKEKRYGDLQKNDNLFFNLANWFSLRRKGHLFIKEYEKQIIPLIDEVFSIQKNIKLPNGKGDILRGFIDFIARFKGEDFKRVVDNKTSSIKYAKNSVITSQQLTIYCEHEEIYDAAYIIIDKNIKEVQTKTCKICNHQSTSKRLKTCNNVTLQEGKRKDKVKKKCGGDLDVVKHNKINIEVIKDSLIDENMDEILDNINDTLHLIQKEIFEPDEDNCYQWGKKCVYFNKCHNNNNKGLIKLEYKK